MEKFINDERNKKTEENIQKVIDLFKKEIEKEGGIIGLEIRYGNLFPQLYISDNISDDLKEKIKRLRFTVLEHNWVRKEKPPKELRGPKSLSYS
jgi:hypothetical protein